MKFKKPEVGDEIIHNQYNPNISILEEIRIGIVELVLSSQFTYRSKDGNKYFCMFKEDWNYFKKDVTAKDLNNISDLNPKKAERLLNKSKPKTSIGEGMEAWSVVDQKVKRTLSVFPNETRIQATGKQPRSEKIIARLKLYRRTKLGGILERNPEVTLTDIKYDIKCGYAEIVQ